MVSTASVTGRTLHRHEIENDALEKELAQEEHRLRANLDGEYADTKASARDAAARPPRSGGRAPIRVPTDKDHIRERVDAIGRLHLRQDKRRAALRATHVKELKAARKVQSTSEKHKPQTNP